MTSSREQTQITVVCPNYSLVLITLRVLSGRQKAKFRGNNAKTCLLLVQPRSQGFSSPMKSPGNEVAFGGEINIVDEKYLNLCAL